MCEKIQTDAYRKGIEITALFSKNSVSSLQQLYQVLHVLCQKETCISILPKEIDSPSFIILKFISMQWIKLPSWHEEGHGVQSLNGVTMQSFLQGSRQGLTVSGRRLSGHLTKKLQRSIIKWTIILQWSSDSCEVLNTCRNMRTVLVAQNSPGWSTDIKTNSN